MKVAALQHDIVWEDPDANFARLAPMIADAAADGARLVPDTGCVSGSCLAPGVALRPR